MSSPRKYEVWNWDAIWQSQKKFDIHSELIDIIQKHSPREKILEVGFGSGGDLLALSRRGFDCTGIEVSEVAYNRAKKILSPKISIIFGDARKMPFNDGEFDAVFHQGVMEHFRDPRKFLSEQWRVLKNDGVVIIDVPHKWNLYTVYKNILGFFNNWYGGWERSFSSSELKQLVTKCHFETIGIYYRGVWPHQWGKFLFPEKIIRRKWAMSLMSSPPVSWISHLCRTAYEKSQFIKAINSYNIIIVARKRPLKIALDARFAKGVGGGINNYITELVSHLNKKGCKVITITSQPLDRKFGKVNSIVLNNYLHWFIWEQVQLPIALFKLKPDIYHATGNWGVPIFHPCPVILTVHDIIPEKLPDYFKQSRWPALAKWLYHLRIQVGLTCANEIICNSKWTARDVKTHFIVDKRKLHTIPMAIYNDFFNEITNADQDALNKSGINKPYILNHGGIDFRKNNQRLVEAFAQALKSDLLMRNWTLVFTGRNSEIEKQLAETSEKLGISQRVMFTGWVNRDKMAVLVRNAGIVAYPTLAEGFGMPLLEAMAAGVPVVASDLLVLKEVGENIPIYVDPMDINSITSGLVGAAKGVQKKKLDRGKSLARQYTWDKVLEETFKIYGTQN